jgi:hypothetical protein
VSYRLQERPLQAAVEWAVEDGDLVRRAKGREERWPLESLTRFTLLRQRNRLGADLRLLQLRFGRRRAGFGSLGWAGVGRPVDQTQAFSAFVRALAREAATAAPMARFDTGGRSPLDAGVWWFSGLLAVAAAAVLAMAVSTRLPAMGIDLAARLMFVLALVAAAAPWLPGRGGHRLDPRALPEDLAPPS